MYKFFQCQKQMFLDSELEFYCDLLKNDKILLQCMRYSAIAEASATPYPNLYSVQLFMNHWLFVLLTHIIEQNRIEYVFSFKPLYSTHDRQVI